jgi:hypothetical protein
MTGVLSDVPELAAQVARLARLRQDTAPFVSHGQFRDNLGLTVKGAIGYVYTSERGVAVTVANGSPRQRTARVALSPAVLGRDVGVDCTLHAEGEDPRRVTAVRRGGALSLQFALPSYQAAVVTWEAPD